MAVDVLFPPVPLDEVGFDGAREVKVAEGREVRREGRKIGRKEGRAVIKGRKGRKARKE